MMYENKGRYIVEFQDIPKARQHQIEIELDERRNNYKEVELGFNEERALLEAKRCLSCRRCLGCALCWAECKPEAIIFEMEDQFFEIEAEQVIVSPGIDRPIERVDKRFGLGKMLNVVTDLQFERMLSDTGPSGGLIIRPHDGEIPRSIAFVQSYASAGPPMHQAALTFAVNEAILARTKLPDAEIAVYASSTESFAAANGGDLQKLDRIVLKETVVGDIQESADHGITLNLGSNGSGETKQFDLVVLITQPQVSKDLKKLSKDLGLTLAYASFLAEAGTGLITTEKESVSLTAQA
jgi:heterodisulfide reductase subunit A-like polyferredoxin